MATTARCPNGASRRRCSLKRGGTATTPHARHPSSSSTVSTSRCSSPPISPAASTRIPGTPNITAAVGQPPSLQFMPPGPSLDPASWSLLILKAPVSHPRQQRPSARHHSTLSGEGPVYHHQGVRE